MMITAALTIVKITRVRNSCLAVLSLSDRGLVKTSHKLRKRFVNMSTYPDKICGARTMFIQPSTAIAKL
jgi:hypothetical protein